MNILIANWSWYPSGGDWTYIKSICDLYELNGHHIIPFSVHNDKNFPTKYDKFFLDQIDYKVLNTNKNLRSGFQVLKKSLYSFEARKKLSLLLKEIKVDIAQLNNINNYQTPAIIPILKNHNIPVVWRILDYKLLCPNTTFVSNDKICEECFKHKYYNCVIKRCKKGSFSASLIAAMESYLYYLLPYYKQIDMFLFQSQFSRDIFIKYGFDKYKMEIIENPFDSNKSEPNYNNRNFILYFGRLEKVKGIYTLLNAMKMLPDIELRVIGDGTEYNNCIRYIENKSINNVTFLGPMWNEELTSVLKDCKFVIVPSEWYEPSPYVVLQTFSYSKPVIASNLGGLNDMIENKINGLTFKAGDPNDLADKINLLYNDDELIYKMGKNARKILNEKYNAEQYYNKTMNIFYSLIEQNKIK